MPLPKKYSHSVFQATVLAKTACYSTESMNFLSLSTISGSVGEFMYFRKSICDAHTGKGASCQESSEKSDCFDKKKGIARKGTDENTKVVHFFGWLFR